MFHVTDNLILSPYTSDLKDHLDASEWDQLNKGWAQLILVMMWETIKGSKSRWAGYLGKCISEDYLLLDLTFISKYACDV